MEAVEEEVKEFEIQPSPVEEPHDSEESEPQQPVEVAVPEQESE